MGPGTQKDDEEISGQRHKQRHMKMPRRSTQTEERIERGIVDENFLFGNVVLSVFL